MSDEPEHEPDVNQPHEPDVDQPKNPYADMSMLEMLERELKASKASKIKNEDKKQGKLDNDPYYPAGDIGKLLEKGRYLRVDKSGGWNKGYLRSRYYYARDADNSAYIRYGYILKIYPEDDKSRPGQAYMEYETKCCPSYKLQFYAKPNEAWYSPMYKAMFLASARSKADFGSSGRTGFPLYGGKRIKRKRNSTKKRKGKGKKKSSTRRKRRY